MSRSVDSKARVSAKPEALGRNPLLPTPSPIKGRDSSERTILDSTISHCAAWACTATAVPATAAAIMSFFIQTSSRLFEGWPGYLADGRSEEHTSELQSRGHLVC